MLKCELAKVSQGRCSRSAAVNRETSAGRIVSLCSKCDAEIGETVGKVKPQIAPPTKRATTIFPKYSVKCSAWGNYYGYRGSKKVEQFFNGPTASQEESAKAWLAKMNAERDAKIEELANALDATWQVIAYDVQEIPGPKLRTSLACCEVAADYVYMYGDAGRESERSKKLSKEIIALSDADFKRVAEKAALGF